MIFYSNVLGCYVKAIFKSDYYKEDPLWWDCLCTKHENGPLKGLECAYSERCLVDDHEFYKEILRVRHLWNDYRIIVRYRCTRAQSMTLGFIKVDDLSLFMNSKCRIDRLRNPQNLKSDD